MWEKLAGLSFAVAIVVLGVGMAWNYGGYGARSLLMDKSRERSVFLESKRGAYEWLLQNTGANTHVIAYEDVGLYLYTGREVLSPMGAVVTELYGMQANHFRPILGSHRRTVGRSN